jgi:hypothetical protein
VTEASKRNGRLALGTVAALALLVGVVIGASGLAPAAAQQARTLGAIVNNVVTCHSPAPCTGGLNSGAGFGVVAVSARSNGVDSATKNPSLKKGVGRSGVYGHDDSTDGGALNVGVAGASNAGTGMVATSNTGVGIIARSTSGEAVLATSTNGYGLTADGGSIGVNATGGGVGVSGFSNTGYGVFAEIGFGGTRAALVARGGTADTTGWTVQGVDVNGNTTFVMDNAGNEYLNGILYTQGSCSAGCSRTRRVESYAPRESVPSMEDVGEGQLVGGKADVRLDPAFANVIDAHASYVVFVSPEGPNHGLYVTQKSASGFTVMENPGGHSTIPFGYRIVAKPYGVTASRLPMVDAPRSSRPVHRQMSLPTARISH